MRVIILLGLRGKSLDFKGNSWPFPKGSKTTLYGHKLAWRRPDHVKAFPPLGAEAASAFGSLAGSFGGASLDGSRS